jgi:hypothetical protein
MKALAVEEQDAVVALLDLSQFNSSSDVQAHQSQTEPSPLQVAKELLTSLLVSYILLRFIRCEPHLLTMF